MIANPKNMVKSEEKTPSTTAAAKKAKKAQEAPHDFSHDVVVTDEDGKRLAAMREYVFLNLASSSN